MRDSYRKSYSVTLGSLSSQPDGHISYKHRTLTGKHAFALNLYLYSRPLIETDWFDNRENLLSAVRQPTAYFIAR
jgi:hypothetical protein